MAILDRLSGAHRLKPGKPLSMVLEGIEARLKADPTCARVDRGSDTLSFAMDPARWRTWRVLIWLYPRGGRVAGGTFAVRPDHPRDLVSYDLSLEVRRPLMVSAFWAVIGLAVAAWGVVATAFAAVVLLLMALRYVLRQSETEWVHRLIGDAASVTADTGAARSHPRPAASSAS